MKKNRLQILFLTFVTISLNGIAQNPSFFNVDGFFQSEHNPINLYQLA
jgi:hypothetical protein